MGDPMMTFEDAWGRYSRRAYETAREKGFWDVMDATDVMALPARIALIHSELSDALTGYRDGNPPDKRLPEFDTLTVELADAVIRIMDLAVGLGLPVGAAVEAKMDYNAAREPLHGRRL